MNFGRYFNNICLALFWFRKLNSWHPFELLFVVVPQLSIYHRDLCTYSKLFPFDSSVTAPCFTHEIIDLPCTIFISVHIPSFYVLQIIYCYLSPYYFLLLLSPSCRTIRPHTRLPKQSLLGPRLSRTTVPETHRPLPIFQKERINRKDQVGRLGPNIKPPLSSKHIDENTSEVLLGNGKYAWTGPPHPSQELRS